MEFILFIDFFSSIFAHEPVKNDGDKVRSSDSDASPPGKTLLQLFDNVISDITEGLTRVGETFSQLFDSKESVNRLKGVGAILAGVLALGGAIVLMCKGFGDVTELAAIGAGLIIAGCYMLYTGKDDIGFFHN